MKHLNVVRCLRAVLALMLITPSASAKMMASEAFPGLIGDEDRREILDSERSPWNAVGRVNIAGFSRSTMCTGTLVAPNIVLTAAHCLVDPRTGKAHKAESIHFLAGLRRDEYVEHQTAECLLFPENYRFTAEPKLSDIIMDVGVIVLREPLKVPPMGLAIGSKTTHLDRLMSVGYSRERPYLLTADKTCGILEKREGVWLTDCYTNYGGSGGPVLRIDDPNVEKGQLAAVMVAVAPQRYTLAIPKNVWGEMVEKASCDTTRP
ncbi:trypsin-like serine protease [Rhodobacteraceae bacterium RKSG542]|uniref:trypsin-like peptidase domain-containing protein n=1 Tax=Pseudovibrio flavus TaxID=2529854 RepID=UPI0012BBCC9D|nr:trypsin-like peptidase domain-containing protein [Pseudovibrio flavus]MTI18873.1 trypsin-like serine protease [Pseudovibrio flavus]